MCVKLKPLLTLCSFDLFLKRTYSCRHLTMMVAVVEITCWPSDLDLHAALSNPEGNGMASPRMPVCPH